MEDTYKAVEGGRSGKAVAQPLVVGTRSSSRSTAKITNIVPWGFGSGRWDVPDGRLLQALRLIRGWSSCLMRSGLASGFVT